VQSIFEFNLKDSHKRAKQHQACLSVSQRVQSIFEFNLKDMEKTPKNEILAQ
jgi:hypothetical protein